MLIKNPEAHSVDSVNKGHTHIPFTDPSEKDGQSRHGFGNARCPYLDSTASKKMGPTLPATPSPGGSQAKV